MLRLFLLCGIVSLGSSTTPAPTPEEPFTILKPVSGTYAYDQRVRVEWVSSGSALACDFVDVILYSNSATGREYFASIKKEYANDVEPHFYWTPEDTTDGDGVALGAGIVGSDYQIRVSCEGNVALQTYSDAFDVSLTPAPTPWPTNPPSALPTSLPSLPPSQHPTTPPTFTPKPSGEPSQEPTQAPTPLPSPRPTKTYFPSAAPTFSLHPTSAPTITPTQRPTLRPSLPPTSAPSLTPTSAPTPTPSSKPSPQPSQQPTFHPTPFPSIRPTGTPSLFPTPKPTNRPTSWGEDTTNGWVVTGWVGLGLLSVALLVGGVVAYRYWRANKRDEDDLTSYVGDEYEHMGDDDDDDRTGGRRTSSIAGAELSGGVLSSSPRSSSCSGSSGAPGRKQGERGGGAKRPVSLSKKRQEAHTRNGKEPGLLDNEYGAGADGEGEEGEEDYDVSLRRDSFTETAINQISVRLAQQESNSSSEEEDGSNNRSRNDPASSSRTISSLRTNIVVAPSDQGLLPEAKIEKKKPTLAASLFSGLEYGDADGDGSEDEEGGMFGDKTSKAKTNKRSGNNPLFGDDDDDEWK